MSLATIDLRLLVTTLAMDSKSTADANNNNAAQLRQEAFSQKGAEQHPRLAVPELERHERTVTKVFSTTSKLPRAL